MKHFLSLIFLFLGTFLAAQVPGSPQPTPQPYWQFYFSFGGGPSFLSGFPQEVYQDGHANLQLGFMAERTFGSRFSVIGGLELEQLTYAFDGQFSESLDEPLSLTQAPAGVKYTRLRQRNLTLPLEVRCYWYRNRAKGEANAFLQGGIRLSLPGTSEFSFRQAQERQTQDLKPFSPGLLAAAELMIGFKGNFFAKFDLLNASSLGVIYQFTPLFETTDDPIRPLQLTWRFLF